MDIKHVAEISLGVLALAMSLFAKEFIPSGWTTRLIWGRGDDARIPRPLGATFYFIVGVALLYWGIFK